ncbi:HepT-like ribonuclease domain-containing protein [Trinickia sp.]|uniref:HepT-like ribonuclease domain-containing protein n=1 Tax=Trinickia sp. TaxID=2571163 RepID=UPI003F802739
MSRDQGRLADYLEHILEAIRRIGRYTADMDEPAFVGNEMVQDAVIRNFEIIGEASNNVEKHYPEFAASHPELPLASAYQMHNAVAHGYSKVDLQIVWRTLQTDLPKLFKQVQALAESLSDSSHA